MKIFPKDTAAPVRTERPNAPAKEGKIARKKGNAPLKKEMSANDIKEKLAAHVNTSDAAKNMAIKSTKKLGEGFLNEDMKPVTVDVVNVEAPKLKADGAEVSGEDIKTPNTKDLTIRSDIALNDPKDTNTQEKLKSVIAKGGFSFNPKEREALEKILAG